MKRAKFLVFLAISASLGGATLGQANSASLASITSYLRTGNFDAALELLRPALKQNPQNPQLWSLQGLALSGEKRDKEAIEAFGTALKLSPDYLPALEGAAQIQYEAGSQDAVPLLQRLLRVRPNDPTTHAMLGVLAYGRGDCPTAVQHLEKSEVLAEAQIAILQQLGSCLVRLRRASEAISVFQKVLDRNPDDPLSRYRVAAVQLLVELPRDSLRTLAPLLQSNTSDPRILELAATAYEANDETLHAVQTMRQAIVLNPRDVDLYLEFANISIDHQSYQVGIDMTNAGINVQPDAAPLYVVRGVLYVQLGRFEEAEADFEKANTLDPEQSIGSVAQGLAAVQRSDPDSALATVQTRLASTPNDPYLLYLQADLLARKGPVVGSKEFRLALHSATRAIALRPSMSAARDVLAKLLREEGQTGPAIDQCRKALDSDPKDQTALYRLIQLLRDSSQTVEIPDLLKRLSELREQSTRLESEHNRYKLIEEAPSR